MQKKLKYFFEKLRKTELFSVYLKPCCIIKPFFRFFFHFKYKGPTFSLFVFQKEGFIVVTKEGIDRLEWHIVGFYRSTSIN